jgi:ankyrin repeat protein
MTAVLLKHGARLGDQDSAGDTPFLLACSRGLHLHAVELLDAGAAINQGNWSTGLTPVMLVVGRCNSEELAARGGGGGGEEDNVDDEELHLLFSELLDRDADCAVVDNRQMSALHYACRQGDLSVCSSLLQAGVEQDVQSCTGATPLCLAACLQSVAIGSSSHELCGLLIARGSYPRIRDQQGRQALHYAAGETPHPPCTILS